MNEAELKAAINQKINQLSEDQLKVVLDILEQVKTGEKETSINMELIFNEAIASYGDVLKRLAQ